MSFELVIHPHPTLYQVASPIEKIDKSVQNVFKIMLKIMKESQGIGLAANQIALLKRLIVIDIDKDKTESRCPDIEQKSHKIAGQYYIANPKIINHSDEVILFKEGCLSFPNIFADVKRFEYVTVQYLDFDGKEQLLEATGLLSVCLQHEIDHLNGITFIQHLSKFKQHFLLKKLQKQLNKK